MKYLKKLCFVFILNIINLSCVFTNDYKQIQVTLQGKKLLGSGIYKEAVLGEVLSIETSCCIYDFRKQKKLTVIDKEEFYKYTDDIPKKIIVKTNNKVVTYKVDKNALFFSNGKKSTFWGTASASEVHPFYVSYYTKGIYTNVYMLLDQNEVVQYIESFFLFVIDANVVKINKAKNYLIFKDPGLWDILLGKGKQNKDVLYKTYFAKNYLVTRNYQLADLSALKGAKYVQIFFNLDGEIKRIDTFFYDINRVTSAFNPDENNKLKPLEYNNKLYYITDNTKLYKYGWKLSVNDFISVAKVWCCEGWITLNNKNNTIDTIIIWVTD